MVRTIGSVALGLGLIASLASAAPGDPFGGDDDGCVPADKVGYTCGAKIGAALGKLTESVIKCHIVQEGHAFKASHSAIGFDNAEENCELGPSNTSAKARFDAVVAKYTPVCDPALVTAAQAQRDVLLADQTETDSLDALNGSFFCDATSGLTIAEPGGDDAGYIPASANAQKCAVGAAKAYAKLVVSVYKCHAKAAQLGLAGRPFDEDACEDGAPPLRSARAKYDATLQKYVAAGICPSCVATNAPTLADDAIAALDAQAADLFPCP